jgi:HEAT repeat protein
MRICAALVVFAGACAGGAAESRLAAELDPALRRGDVAGAVRAYERAGVDDARRLKQTAEVVVWQALAAPDARVRERATRIAADLADPALDQQLGARLIDEDARVRAVAAAAFAAQLDAARQVVAAALDGSDPAARAIAVTALPTLGDARARLDRLLADPSPDVRAAALAQLAVLKPANAGALARGLLHDDDAGVRAAALRALAAVGSRGFAADVDAELADPSLGVRLAALHALERLSGPERLVLIAQAGDRFVALRAAVALAHRGRADEALAAVERAASDRRADARAAAMNAAGELGAPALRVVLPLLRDVDLEVRLAAARAAAQLGRAGDATRVFAAALDTPSGLDAADELARLGDERGRARLRAAVRAPDARVRAHALALYAPLPGSLPSLAHALADADAGVRLIAADAILRKSFR